MNRSRELNMKFEWYDPEKHGMWLDNVEFKAWNEADAIYTIYSDTSFVAHKDHKEIKDNSKRIVVTEFL